MLLRRPAAVDCARVGALGDRAICRNSGLIAADRRMARAYAAAVVAGVSDGRLRRSRLDWLNLREDAARYSTPAVEKKYRHRIQQLEAAAEKEPPH
jgi:uncharacterized protein